MKMLICAHCRLLPLTHIHTAVCASKFSLIEKRKRQPTSMLSIILIIKTATTTKYTLFLIPTRIHRKKFSVGVNLFSNNNTFYFALARAVFISGLIFCVGIHWAVQRNNRIGHLNWFHRIRLTSARC